MKEVETLLYISKKFSSFFCRNSFLVALIFFDSAGWCLFLHYLELSDRACVNEYIENSWPMTVFACQGADIAGSVLMVLTLAAVLLLILAYILFELIRAFSVISTGINRMSAFRRCIVLVSLVHLAASLLIFVS